jgi:serine/threonine protein kinase
MKMHHRNHLARQAVSLDWGAYYADGQQAAPKFLPVDTEPDDEAVLASGGHVWQQSATTTDLHGMVVHKLLGAGSFGVAFSATLAGQEVVVKLPKALVAPAFQSDTLAEGAYAIRDILLPQQKLSDAEMQMLRKDFEGECRNAAHFLEPPALRIVRSDNGIGPVTKPMQRQNWRALRNEVRRWRMMMGQSQWHKILHFDSSIPALISDRADGTLADLRMSARPQFAFSVEEGPSLLWRHIAEQLNDAMTFMRLCVDMVHVDLKPQNILYVIRQPGRVLEDSVECKISDYGLCYPRGAIVRGNKRGQVMGTPLYSPSPEQVLRHWSGKQAVTALSMFQYAATLLDLLDGAGVYGYLSEVGVGGRRRKCISDTLKGANGQPLMSSIIMGRDGDSWRTPLFHLASMMFDGPERQVPLFKEFETALLEDMASSSSSSSSSSGLSRGMRDLQLSTTEQTGVR